MSSDDILELFDRVPVPRHEVLAAVRGDMERYHRESVWVYSASTKFRPCSLTPGSCPCPYHDLVEDMWPEHSEDCCNRTVPIYVIPGVQDTQKLFAFSLFNWLYGRWYKPYRNEIEHCRFFSKQFFPCAPPENTDLVPFINNLHQKICSQVKSYQEEAAALPVITDRTGGPSYRDQRFLVLQPLFEAMTIVILQDDFNVCDPDLDNLPCLITLTNQDDNLSAPIDFSSIKHNITNYVSEAAVQVPLHVAFDFVMSLEQREIDAFGLQPDPMVSAIECLDTNTLGYSDQDLNYLVQRLGGGNELVQGPSSTWVDTTVYTGRPNAMVLVEKDHRWFEEINRKEKVHEFIRTNLSHPQKSLRNAI